MNLLILTGIFPPDTGGPATYVPRIANALCERGWSVEVVTAGRAMSDRTFPFDVHRVPRSVLRRLPTSLPLIRDRLARSDSVYVNGLELDYVLASVGDDTPSTLKIVGDRSWEKHRNRGEGHESIESFQEGFPGVRSALDRSLHRWVARRFDRYVVPSQYLKSLIGHWGIQPEDVDVIPNHAHPPDSVPEEPLDWPDADRKLLSVGRMVPWKRFPQLIEFLADLEGFGLVLLGDGPEYEQCERIVRDRDLEDRILLKGAVPRETVWSHLHQADLFVLNSTYEGFPHVLLESVQAGTPVLASNSGGSRELAQYFPEAVTLFDRDHPEQLADELHQGTCLDPFELTEWPGDLSWPDIVDRTARTLEATN